jgi:hypothetical protein
MASIGSLFEDFNLDDLSSDDENGFDFPPLDESDVELHDEHELFHQGVLRKWRSYEQNFRVRRINNVDRLFNDTHKIRHLIVPYVEE